MLVSNDAHLYRFEVEVTSLDNWFKSLKPMSVMWKKDEKEAETEKSLPASNNNVTFKNNTLVLNLRLMKDEQDNFRAKDTEFIVYEHDSYNKREVGKARFQITSVLESEQRDYTLEVLSQGILKGYLNITAQQKFVMKVSEFKFNRSNSPVGSSESSISQRVDIDRSRASRRLSVEDQTHSRYKDEADSLFIENRRLKTDHERLATKTKQVEAKTKKNQKVLLWECKQMREFYEKKLRIAQQVYEQAIEKIVFSTNGAKDEYRQRVEELQLFYTTAEEKYEHSMRELKQAREEVARVKQDFGSLMEEERRALEVERAQYLSQSSERMKTEACRIEELEDAMSQNQKKMEEEIDQKKREIQELKELRSQALKQMEDKDQSYGYLLQVQGQLDTEKASHQQTKNTLLKMQTLLEALDMSPASSSMAVEDRLQGLLDKYAENLYKLQQSLTTLQSLKTSEPSNTSKTEQINRLKAELKQETEHLKAKLEEKERTIQGYQLKDDVGLKNIKNLQSLLDFEKESQQLFSNRLEMEINESQSLRRHLREKDEEMMEKEQLLNQLTSHAVTLESKYKVMEAERESYKDENVHLQEMVQNLETILAKKTTRTGPGQGLVEQLHGEIEKKNQKIVELETKQGRLISTLAHFRNSGVDLEYVIDTILAEEYVDDDLPVDSLGKSTSRFHPEDARVGKEEEGHYSPQFPAITRFTQPWQYEMEILNSRVMKFYKMLGRQKEETLLSLEDTRSIDIERLRQRIRGLGNSQEELQSICDDLESVRSQSNEYTGRLQHINENVTEENQRLKEEIQALNREVEGLLKRERYAKNNVPQLSQRENSLMSELEELSNKLRELEKKREECNTDYERRLEESNTREQNQGCEVLNHERNNQKQRKQINDLNTKLQDSLQKAMTLDKALEVAKKDLEDLRTDIIRKEALSVDLSKENRLLIDSTHKANKELQQLEERNRSRELSLQSTMEQLRSDLSKTLVEVSLSKEEIQGIHHNNQGQMEVLRNVVMEREYEIQMQYKSIETHKRQEAERDTQLRHLQAKLKEANSCSIGLREEYELRLNDTKRQLSKTVQQKHCTDNLLRDMKSRYQADTDHSLSSQRSSREWKEKYEENNIALSLSKKELKLRCDQIEEWQVAHKHLKASLQKLREEKVQLEDELSVSQQRNDEANRWLTTSNSSVLVLQQELESAKGQLNLSNRNLIHMQLQLNQMKSTTESEYIAKTQWEHQLRSQVEERNLYIEELKRSLTLQSKSTNLTAEQLSETHKFGLNVLHQQIAAMGSKQRELSKGLAEKEDEVIQSREEVKRCEEKLSQERKERHVLIEKHQKKISYQVAIINNLQQEQRCQQEELRQRGRDTELAKSRERDLLDEIKKRGEKEEELTTYLHAERDINKERMKVIGDLNKQVEELKVQNIAQQTLDTKSLVEKESQFKQLSSFLFQLKEDFALYKIDHPHLDQDFLSVSKERDDFKRDHQKLTSRLNRLDKDHKQHIHDLVTAQLRKEQEKNVAIDTSVCELSEEVESLRAKVHTLDQSCAALRQSQSQLQEQLSSANVRLQQLGDQMQSKEVESTSFKRQFTQQNHRLMEENARLAQLETRHHEFTSRIQELSSVVDHLTQQLTHSLQIQAANTHLSLQLQKVLESHKQERNSLLNTQQDLSTKLDLLDQTSWMDLARLNKQLISKQEQLDHYISNNNQKEHFIQQLQLNVQLLEGRLPRGQLEQPRRPRHEIKRTETVPAFNHRL